MAKKASKTQHYTHFNNAGAFLLRFYGCFFVAVGVSMAPCNLLDASVAPWTSGTASLACVVGWNLAFVCSVPRKSRLWKQWEFCALLSLIMPIPDLFLVKVLATLVFSPSPLRIGGEVPAAMMGMWTIALLPVIHLANMYGSNTRSRAVVGGLVAGMWFFGSEFFCAPFLHLWHPTPKVQLLLGNVPVYVVIAEAVLGAAVVHAEHDCRVRGGGDAAGRFCGAVAVMLIYGGALAVAWLVLEVGMI